MVISIHLDFQPIHGWTDGHRTQNWLTDGPGSCGLVASDDGTQILLSVIDSDPIVSAVAFRVVARPSL